MSIITSNPGQIHDSPLNSSTAKALYSFPKCERFGFTTKKGDNPNAFYSIGDCKSKRAASFGYGGKFDFTKHVDMVPGPNHYANTDNMSKFGRRGITFGNGREKVTFQGFTVKHTNVPGPGAYNILAGSRHIKGFSIKQRSTSLKKHWNSPGPGYYNHMPTISDKGTFVLSPFRNVTVPSIKTKQVIPKNIEERSIVFPGPGAYSQGIIKENSRSILSNYVSPGGQSIGRQQRNLGKEEPLMPTPGPGNYQLPSEFGHYRNKTSNSLEGSKAMFNEKSVNSNAVGGGAGGD